MPETHELIRAAIPLRHEKRRIARALSYTDESTIYKWCEDQDSSGKPNPLDRLDVILDHALIHHPDAAQAIGQYIQGKIGRALANRGRSLSVAELILSLQPQGEKECQEVIEALSRSLRQLLLAGECDLQHLRREVREAARVLHRTDAMICAVLDTEKEETK